MSMRARGGPVIGRSRHGVRPVYEDFQPMSEWKHEEGVDILLFHLPGFDKEQIRILAESKGVLRVYGQRPIGVNKWSRFQQEVTVPEDCNMNEIRAKLEGGILQVIMPKKTIVHPIQPAPIEGQESPKTSIPKPGSQTLSQHREEELPPKPTPQPPISMQGGPIEPKRQETPPIAPPPRSPIESKQAQMKYGINNEEGFDYRKPKGKEDHYEARGENKDEEANERDKLPKAKKETQGIEQPKRVIKGQASRSLDEDRQLLVNMGVAILVIVGLGAYISYSFGSST